MTLCNTFSLPHPRAGQIAESSDCVDIQLLLHHYYHHLPDPNNPQQQVTFGTSGHRGSALLGSFNEHHILAISQAIAEVRAAEVGKFMVAGVFRPNVVLEVRAAHVSGFAA